MKVLAAIGVCTVWFGLGYAVESLLHRLFPKFDAERHHPVLGAIEVAVIYGPGGVAILLFEFAERRGWV